MRNRTRGLSPRSGFRSIGGHSRTSGKPGVSGRRGKKRGPALREPPTRANPAPGLRGFPAPADGAALRFALGLTAAYALVLAFALFHHELWRDELQAWMLARDSAGPAELFRNMEHEGTPYLWHLLLMPVTRLTSSPVGMQVLQLAIASAVVFVVAKYAPLHPLHKVLFAFGYFPLFEYGVMSRSYGLGLLCIVAACALLRHRRRKPLWLGLALALAGNTSAHACIVAIGLLCALALDRALDRRAPAEEGEAPAWRVHAGLAVAAAGIAVAVLHMVPAPDATLSNLGATWIHQWHLESNAAWLEQCLRLVPSVVFYPLDPDFVPVAGATPTRPEALYNPWVAATLVAAAAAVLWRRPVAAALFLALVAGLLFFAYAVHYGAFRHHGFLLIALLAAGWSGRHLAFCPAGRDPRGGAGAERGAGPGRLIGNVLLTALLAAQAAGGLRAVAIEVERPFSLARQTAAYIRESGLESLPMIGYPDWSASAVVGHLSPGKRIHYVQGNREGSFVRYDGARVGTGPRGATEPAELLSQTEALAARGGGRVLMVLAVGLNVPPGERRIRPLASFTGGLAADENFHLYLYEAPADGGRADGQGGEVSEDAGDR